MSRPFSRERLEQLLIRPSTFLRHDVDFSLAAAISMARLEHELEVCSTYYVMTDNPFYSPTQAVMFAAVVSGLGHQIGWHIDTRKMPAVHWLGLLVPDAEVSFHCPQPDDLWTRFPGVQSAYDPIWKDHYYADSRGWFAHGDPEDHAANETIQINLHCEWWFDPNWYQSLDPKVYEAFFYEPKP